MLLKLIIQGVYLTYRTSNQNFKLVKYFVVFLTVHHSIDLLQVTNLMHTSFII